MNEYYVYMYLREDGTPYYIGKGKGNRAYQKHKGIGTPPIDRIKISHSNLDEDIAYSIEKMLVEKYGRQNNDTGILMNRTDGGYGITGVVNVKWINDGENEKRIKPDDDIPDGWVEGRLWSLSKYYFINNGIKTRAILKTRSIPKGWVKGRLGSCNSGLISINNGVKTKFIKKTDIIPEGWKLGIAYRHNKEQLEKVREGNKQWRWINNGSEDKRVHQSIAIPDGWVRGRLSTGIIVKYDDELIDNILKDYNSGVSKLQIEKRYNIYRKKVGRIIQAPDDYSRGK